MPQSIEYLLIDLPPRPFDLFRSVRSAPPFFQCLRHLEAVTGLDLGFPDVAISTADYAELRTQLARWLSTRRRIGGYSEDRVDLLSVPGFTAPLINPKLKPGHALVARAVNA